MMKKYLKIILLLVVVITTFSLVGCKEDTPQVGDPYTVTFVNYYGEEIDSFSCYVGSDCNIITPNDPAKVGDQYFTRWSVFESDYANIQTDTVIKPIYTLDNIAFTVLGRSVVFYSLFIMTGIDIF